MESRRDAILPGTLKLAPTADGKSGVASWTPELAPNAAGSCGKKTLLGRAKKVGLEMIDPLGNLLTG